MKVVLVGYMASGKSTIGRILAETLEIDFIDLDAAIVIETNLTIPELFKSKGELYFRKMETQVLDKLLSNDKSYVLATGGGTPCYGKNMEMINNNADYSIYLQLSIPTLVERIIKEKSKRPLVANVANVDLPEFVGKHLFERSLFYNIATYNVQCTNKSIEEILKELKFLLS